MIDITNIQLNKLFMIFFNKFNNKIDISSIQHFLIFTMNNIYLIDKLLILSSRCLQNINKKESFLIQKINNIKNKIYNKNNEILFLYNSLSQNKENNNEIKFSLLKKIYNKKIDYNLKNNLDIYQLDTIQLDNLELTNIFENYNIDSNYLGYKKINIGFDNFYNLHSYRYINSNLPFNLLMYIDELDQIIIKIGDTKKYKYINSKLYKVYNTYDTENKHNSILCNNNIKELNKKCYSDNCKYYHDYILGYTDNYHKNRYFSLNPIVFNCPTFKDGSQVKENIKKINWYDAINLYQSSLSNLLIACIHSTN
jgi:hypothetical protein